MKNSVQFRFFGLGCTAFAFVVLGVNTADAQYYSPYHTYHPEHGYVPVAPRFGYGGYGGMTAQMGAGIGAGAAAQGIGQMHESNAKAQVAHQQAMNQYIKNKGLAQEETIESAQRRQKATAEHIAGLKDQETQRIALYNKTLNQMAAAHRLTAEQFDFSRNVLHWPFCLRGEDYAALREKIDQIYASRTPADSGTNSDNYGPIKDACNQMLAIVKTEVKNGMSATDFVTAQHFISSIEYEARFKVAAGK